LDFVAVDICMHIYHMSMKLVKPVFYYLLLTKIFFTNSPSAKTRSRR